LGADDRAGASVVLTAILEIRRRKLPHPPLTLFWPVQEEIGLLGAKHARLTKLGGPKLCFNWDGGPANTATIGATGGYDIDIRVEGIASHAGVHPEAGVSAIAIAARAIDDLVQNGWHGRVVKGDRTGTSNLGVISAGDATNVVTPHLALRAEARSHDSEFRKEIVSAYRPSSGPPPASRTRAANVAGCSSMPT
jgi:tripeptide aminopeptidase